MYNKCAFYPLSLSLSLSLQRLANICFEPDNQNPSFVFTQQSLFLVAIAPFYFFFFKSLDSVAFRFHCSLHLLSFESPLALPMS